MSIFKELLGESVAPEVITKLEEGLATMTEARIVEAVAKAKEEALAMLVEKDATISEKEIIIAEKEVALAEATAIAESKSKELDEVKESTTKEIDELNESYIQAAAGYVQQIKTVSEGADKYISYMKESLVEEFTSYADEVGKEYIKENQEQFDRLAQLDKMTSVFNHLKESFEAHGFYLNEDAKYIQLQGEIAKRDAALQEAQSTITATASALHESKRNDLIESVTKDMVLSDKEAIKTLAEHLNTDSLDGFEKVLNVLVERTLNKNVNTLTETQKQVSQQTVTSQEAPKTISSDSVNHYADKLI